LSERSKPESERENNAFINAESILIVLRIKEVFLLCIDSSISGSVPQKIHKAQLQEIVFKLRYKELFQLKEKETKDLWQRNANITKKY
jgi:hypothetical protein